MAGTLSDVRSQLKPSDRIVVIADNCSDHTAETARRLGAEVTERNDLERIGKGYALACGLEYLARDRPDVVIFVDADCRVASGALGSLALEAFRSNKPTQALYHMTAPANSSVSQQVAEFAWRCKNVLRPSGLKAMSLPCQLMGTGMAFPWEVIRSVNLASGHIVEDLKLGLDLARLGHAPRFLPNAALSSTFPSSEEGSRMQRQRWEHGHLGLIASTALPFLVEAVRQRNFNQMAMTLDLLVPPLSLLALLTLGLIGLAGLATGIGFQTGLALSLLIASLSLLFASIFLAWFTSARDILPVRSLVQVPAYVLSKVPVYLKFLLGRGVSVWIRSDRA